ncbi:nicotinate-nucleotide adenylyltransferase [Ferrigenium sp. UT5]|uniref:nicotinate-nucleotide adenylyltransferase n=1 Tax=Ferrigenium sp. UT5 TaxID=3242105 RepID=UPI00354F86CA
MGSAPIGILGGTFDPVHHGHLRIAQEALEQCGLARICFVPSGTPPHRTAPCASAQARWEMVRLAIAGHPEFQVDVREVFRSDPCYTVDTLTSLRAELGLAQPLCLILGGDAFLQLHTWHDWRQLFALAHIVVLQRAGGQPLGNAMAQADAALQAEYRARLAPGALALHEAPAGRIFVADMPALDISATDIRRRCAEKKSLRSLVPDAVVHYIHTHSLYRPC